MTNPVCIICNKRDNGFSECKDLNSWKSLLEAAKLRNHLEILNINIGENGMPTTSVKYHRECRSAFTHKKSLEKLKPIISTNNSTASSSRRTSIRDGNSIAKQNILPSICLICNKEKYLPKTRTREDLLSCAEFRADKRLKQCALQHISSSSELKNSAEKVLSICDKDLISSEAKYHKSCYKYFVRIDYCMQNKDTLTNENEKINSIVFNAISWLIEEIVEQPGIYEFNECKIKIVNKLKLEGHELSKSQLKNLKRTVRNNFDDLNFLEQTTTTLVYPKCLNIEDIIIENFQLNKQINASKKFSHEQKQVFEAAKLLHNKIQNIDTKMPWPPSESDLATDKLKQYIPELLEFFYVTLITGKTDKEVLQKTKNQSNSFSSDVIFAVTNGKIKTPKSILFPSVIKSLCNSKEIIKIINQYGHGICYDLLRELETDYALNSIEQQNESKVVIPQEAFTYINDIGIMVADNIDNLEHTLTGAGTSHRVNSILAQSKAITVQPIEESADFQIPKKRRRMKSLPDNCYSKALPEYISGKRIGPGVLNHLSNLTQVKYNSLRRKQFKEYLIWLQVRKLKTHYLLLAPGWTGFNISIRQNVVVIESAISYLDVIDSPATDLRTAYQVLCRGAEIQERLALESVLCVFDQSFYAKAMEVYWKNKDQFKNLIIMLGGFHLLMMLLGVIGLRFGDAGLREIVIQSDLISEGSIDRALTGKGYNRGVYLHKSVYETFTRYLIDKCNSTNNNNNEIIVNLKKKLEILGLETCTENFEELINDEEYTKYFENFQTFVDDMKTHGSELQKFWLTYLDLVELVLNLILATRTGDWEFYLACIEEVLPWAFAYDRLNYSKYLLPFLNDMRDIKNSHPVTYKALIEGQFAVQMGSNCFGRNEADKTIENTINRDCKTKGGYIGFSTNFGATQKWVLNSTRRSTYRRILNNHLSLTQGVYKHKELAPGRIKKDIIIIDQITTIIDTMFQNPWDGNQLTSLSTGIKPSDIVKADLLQARDKGAEKCKNFIEERCSKDKIKSFFDPLKKANLKTFSHLKHVSKIKTKDAIIALKLDRTLFARMALIGQSRKIDLKQVFSYPLGPLPWSLADSFGLIRKTNKAQLLHTLVDDVTPASSYPKNAAIIYDGMALVQKLSIPPGATFQRLAEIIFDIVIGISSYRVDVVFDCYWPISIKNAERVKRNISVEGVQYQNILPSYPVKCWNKFLSSPSNKTEFVKFLVSEWKKPTYLQKLSSKVLYVTEAEICWKLDSERTQEVPELKCLHEEADTRMILHAKHAKSNVVIHADDTDVLVLLLSHAKLLNNVYMKLGKGLKSKVIELKEVTHKMKLKINPNIDITDFMRSLIGIHAFTGCDSISAFAGKGKNKGLKLLMKSNSYVNLFKDLGNEWDVSESCENELESFVCNLYGKEMSDINELRYKLYCSKGGRVEPEALPPCKSNLKLHIKRANYQAAIWKRAVEPQPIVPSPDNHGWMIRDDELKIKWMSSKPAPDEILEFLSCKCKKECIISRCCCLKAGLQCTDLCLIKCANTNENLSNDDSSDYSSDED